jgi:hypothetical protein
MAASRVHASLEQRSALRTYFIENEAENWRKCERDKELRGLLQKPQFHPLNRGHLLRVYTNYQSESAHT